MESKIEKRKKDFKDWKARNCKRKGTKKER